mmetsp:Transcript_43295/g.113771  ORF Transcript_43295/g.113771 Transcript_43295/m.113771 type:complete len:555 (-) Transcript_43295:926-2590(-)
MRHGVLDAQPDRAERHVLHRRARRLPVDEVAIHERVLEERDEGVHVVLAHLADVLEEERERLEHAILHVELGDAVLVHQPGQHGERRARLCDDGDGDGGAHAVLALLYLEVLQQGGEHVLRADGLRNVPKGVDRRPADRLLVCLQHVEQLEADAHPLARGDELGAAVGDAADEVDAVLLHDLVPILEDRREARQQVLDGRRHLRHADHVDDRLERAEDRAEHLGILLAEILVQHDAEVAHELLLAARAHHDGDARHEVRRLLPHLGGLVVEPPLDRAADLWQVRLRAAAERVHDGAEAVEHDGRVLARLLLEGEEDAVDELLLEPLVDVRRREVGDDLLDRLHDHLAVRLRLVLEVLDDARDNLGGADLVGQLLGRLDELAVVAPVERHPAHPKVPEEVGEDLVAHVLRRHALGRDALLNDLEDNLLHLLVGRGELAQQDDHDLARVVVGVLGVHQRDDEADRLEEGRQPLAAVLPDALPQRLQHRVEGFDPVRRGRLGECGEREGGDGAHLLLLVLQPALDDLDQRLQVRQHRAPQQDGDLLHDLDARVPRLP